MPSDHMMLGTAQVPSAGACASAMRLRSSRRPSSPGVPATLASTCAMAPIVCGACRLRFRGLRFAPTAAQLPHRNTHVGVGDGRAAQAVQGAADADGLHLVAARFHQLH